MVDASAESIAVGFPGQGGDWNAALRCIATHVDHPLVRALRETLGEKRLVPESQVDARISQPTVFVAGLVAADVAGLRPGEASVAAAIGHSLGELTACTFIGMLSAEDGFTLALRRGELTFQAQHQQPGAMLLVAGVGIGTVEWLRRRASSSSKSPLDLAVHNNETQFVLAGAVAAVEACLDLAVSEGIRARRLPIGGAFHSQLMMDAVEPFEKAASAVEWSSPRVPFVLSTAPELEAGSTSVATHLSRSLVLPVRWGDAIDQALKLGITTIVDAGPGDTLVRLARFETRIPTRPIND